MGTQGINIIFIIFNFLHVLIAVYNFIFFIWILSSWLPVNRSIFILRFVDAMIGPVYSFLLRYLPPLRLGMFDFSPFYMIISLYLIEILLNVLKGMVFTMLLPVL